MPDGVLFGSSKAHKTLRKILVEDQKLDAIISMPSGVFKPYAGVSTAILLFTKTNSGGTDNVWFYDMQADGYSLDDKRTPQPDKSDLPDILARWQKRDAESEARADRPELPRAQGRDRGQRLRPLDQPLQGSGVRGGGVRPAEGDPGAAGEAGGGDRQGAEGVGGDVGMKIDRLGGLATFLSGFAFKSNLFNGEGKGMPIVRIRDVVRGRSETFGRQHRVDDGPAGMVLVVEDP